MAGRSNACNNPTFKRGPACWETRLKHGVTIEHCSYCGSVSPAEAIKFLKQPGTRFSGSDWKYGWPHKFYIEPVNPNSDRLEECGSESGPGIDGTHPDDRWVCYAHNRKECSCPKEKATGFWSRIHWGHYEHIYCKFYNNHLHDATEEEFREFAALSLKIFGIEWSKDSTKGLGYSSPAAGSPYGYQRAGILNAQGEPVFRF